MLTSVLHDLRYALRTLARNPGFTCVSMLALALGVGANSAIFTVVNAVLLQPLRFHKPEQLAWVHERNLEQGFPVFSLSPGNYADFRDHNRSFSGFAAFSDTGLNLSGLAEPERLQGARVTAEFFDVLGTKPELGRTFAPQEMQVGSNREVVLSYGLWQRLLGGRTDVLERQLKLNGVAYTVIGVMPQDFQFPDTAEIWIPMALNQAQWQQRDGHYLWSVGRLKDGVTIASAGADLNTIAARAEREFPESNLGWDTAVKTLQDQAVGRYRAMLWSLTAVVGAVLLIACVNLANLLLSRSSARRREIGIRSSLGAGRGRLIRQLLTESVLLAGMGAALGLGLAWAATRVLIRLAPNILPRTREIGIDWRVLCFTAAIALLTGVLFGLAPAIELAKTHLAVAVRDGGRGSSMSFRRNRLRSVLVVGEVALSLVLLSSAGLLMRSFDRLQSADPGFDPHQVLTFRVDLPVIKYKNKEEKAGFYRRALDRLRTLPQVDSAGVAQNIALSGNGYVEGLIQIGKPPVPKGTEPGVEYYSASPGYFSSLRIAFKAGRNFTDRDDASAPQVAIISEDLARKYYPGENPLGQRLRVTNDSPPAEIVGVVGEVRELDMESEGLPAVYEPAAQTPFPAMYFTVRTEADPSALIPAVRAVMREMDSDLPLDAIGTGDSLRAKSISTQRFDTFLMALFAALALVLAMVGIFGVLSYAVTQATQEIGIRMALGAGRGDVLRMVLGHAAVLVAAGFAIGLAAALGAGRLLRADLYQVKPEDPATYVAVGLLLLLTALIACGIPALRALRVNPLIALREE